MKRKRYKTAKLGPIISKSLLNNLSDGSLKTEVFAHRIIIDTPTHDWLVACESAARFVIEFLEDEEEKDENPHL